MGRSATQTTAHAFRDTELAQIAQNAQWVSVRELTDRLPISRTQIQKLVADGTFVTTQIGQKILIEKASFDAYLASRIKAVHLDTPRSTPPQKQRENTRQRIYEHLSQAA